MRLLDIARGAYVRSPPVLRRSLAPFVALAPQSLKYGRSYRQCREDILRSTTDHGFADERLTGSLRALLARAWEAPFYRERLKSAFGPSPDFRAIIPDDLQHIEVATKADLMAAGEAALAAPKATLDAGATSGSNGEVPFTFYLDRDRSVREIAFINHVWARTGYSERDARALFRGFRLDSGSASPYEWEPALKELRLSVFPLNREAAALYLDQIDARGIEFIHGYPSAIEIFCRQLKRLERRPRRVIRAIFPISEPVLPHQRALFGCVFPDAAVTPFYGLSERTLFAAEDADAADVYTFEPLYGFAELLDSTGRRINKAGVEGRIVGTGFMSTGMPFLRYDTHDLAELVEPATRANGWRLKVRNLTPRRKPCFLIDKDGQRIAVTDLSPEEPKLAQGIREYQIRQVEPGVCTLIVVLAEGGGPDDLARLHRYISDKLEGRVVVEVDTAARLIAGSQGKRAYVDQRLDITRY